MVHWALRDGLESTAEPSVETTECRYGMHKLCPRLTTNTRCDCSCHSEL